MSLKAKFGKKSNNVNLKTKNPFYLRTTLPLFSASKGESKSTKEKKPTSPAQELPKIKPPSKQNITLKEISNPKQRNPSTRAMSGGNKTRKNKRRNTRKIR